jgi:hypothetical protein
MITISNKEDAIEHIKNLYPIGQTNEWDLIWLDTIEEYGYENLPTKLLAIMAKKMLDYEGEDSVVELEQGEQEVNPYILTGDELDKAMEARQSGLKY